MFELAPVSFVERENKRKIQIENKNLHWDLNKQPFAPQAGTLDCLVMLTVDKLCLKV